MDTTAAATADDVLDDQPVRRALDALDGLTWLDPFVTLVRRGATATALDPVRNALRGEWLGHRLHPALVQIPIGCWSSAAVLDLFPGERRASSGLIALGLLSVPPAALTGWIDWADLPPERQRAGLVHSAANLTASALYTASLCARLRGRWARGRVLGWSGLAVAGVGGLIGGHLAHREPGEADETAQADAGSGTAV
ncbi:DUF2231 domain-containing protein [Streptacidiphilus jiangxiensis]|uniref:DUF2231 domain-containing protein n=1 Tax=Streptacidiphilus jiangxiensis TaxID=235985 RepID=A0A1H7HCB0_STRJI|nr:DUF2231 domain-containing protein [Streptacidiphilus jiangxiensis]SEK47397.1 hypothetical protein SAMN05414137_102140 [Streptacidiphilus jiangxiensis]